MYREGEHPNADLQAYPIGMYIYLFSRRLKNFQKMQFGTWWDIRSDSVFVAHMSKAVLLACREKQRSFWEMFMKHRQWILQNRSNFIEYAVTFPFDVLFGENDIFDLLINFNAFTVELIAFAYAQGYEDYVWFSHDIWRDSYEIFFKGRFSEGGEMDMLRQRIERDATVYDNLLVERRDGNGNLVMQDGWLNSVENDFLSDVELNDDNIRKERSSDIHGEQCHASGSENEELGQETSSAQKEASISKLKTPGKPANISQHKDTCRDKTFSFSGGPNESEFPSLMHSPSEITAEVTRKVACTSTALDSSHVDYTKRSGLAARASETFSEALECLSIVSNMDASDRRARISPERGRTVLTDRTEAVQTRLPNEDGRNLFADVLQTVKKIFFCIDEGMDSVPSAFPDAVINQNCEISLPNKYGNGTASKLFANILETVKEIIDLCTEENMDSVPSEPMGFPDSEIDQNVAAGYLAELIGGTDTEERKNNLPEKHKIVEKERLESITNPLREQTLLTKQNLELDRNRKVDDNSSKNQKDSFETIPDVLGSSKNFHTEFEASFDATQSAVDNDFMVTGLESRFQEMGNQSLDPSVPRRNYKVDELKAFIERSRDKTRLYPECRTSKDFKIRTKEEGPENYSCTKTPDLTMGHFARRKTLTGLLHRSYATKSCLTEGSDSILSDITEEDKSIEQSMRKGEDATLVTPPRRKGRNSETTTFSKVTRFKLNVNSDLPLHERDRNESKSNVESPEFDKTCGSKKTYSPQSPGTPSRPRKRIWKHHRRSKTVSEVVESSESSRDLAEIIEKKQLQDLHTALRLENPSTDFHVHAIEWLPNSSKRAEYRKVRKVSRK